MPGKIKRTVSTTQQNNDNNISEIQELKKMVKELQNKKEPRKLSALNKLKKYVLSPITEQAMAETDYYDLIPVDKMRLLNKAYPIIWEQLVLKPLYQKYGCRSAEDQERLKAKRNIQLEYNLQVDSIIDQMKSGELDDQEHFKEDLAAAFAKAIQSAAQTFDSQ